jgi:hypothetical protein
MTDQDLSPKDIARVQATFDRVWSTADDTAERFYALLFEIAPQVRGLFHGDLTEHGDAKPEGNSRSRQQSLELQARRD